MDNFESLVSANLSADWQGGLQTPLDATPLELSPGLLPPGLSSSQSLEPIEQIQALEQDDQTPLPGIPLPESIVRQTVASEIGLAMPLGEMSAAGFSATGLLSDAYLTDSVAATENLQPTEGGDKATAADSTAIDAFPAFSGDSFVVPSDGSGSFTLRFDWTLKDADFNNEMGVFVVDQQGRVGGLRPGAAGYAQAALTDASRQVIFASGQGVGNWRELTFQPGQILAFYLIQNGSTESWLIHAARFGQEHPDLLPQSSADDETPWAA